MTIYSSAVSTCMDMHAHHSVASAVGTRLTSPCLLPQGMVCIEAAVAKSGPYTIPAGASWEGTSLLTYFNQ
jgi:hypothetical protein